MRTHIYSDVERKDAEIKRSCCGPSSRAATAICVLLLLLYVSPYYCCNVSPFYCYIWVLFTTTIYYYYICVLLLLLYTKT